MRKRIRNKIVSRLAKLDDILCLFFSHGGIRTYSEEIGKIRSEIRWHGRRWPELYYQTFRTEYHPKRRQVEIDLGHWRAGR